MNKVKLFQVFLCITNKSIIPQWIVFTDINDKTVLFQTIEFSISNLIALKCQTPIDRTRSGVTTPGQNEPGSDGTEGVLRIPHNSNITEDLPTDY